MEGVLSGGGGGGWSGGGGSHGHSVDSAMYPIPGMPGYWTSASGQIFMFPPHPPQVSHPGMPLVRRENPDPPVSYGDPQPQPAEPLWLGGEGRGLPTSAAGAPVASYGHYPMAGGPRPLGLGGQPSRDGAYSFPHGMHPFGVRPPYYPGGGTFGPPHHTTTHSSPPHGKRARTDSHESGAPAMAMSLATATAPAVDAPLRYLSVTAAVKRQTSAASGKGAASLGGASGIAAAAAVVDWRTVEARPMPDDMPRKMEEYASRIDGTTNAFDYTVRIFNSRVVQKSYGSEKRFFCPPPNVFLTEPAEKTGYAQPDIGVGITDGPECRFDSQIDIEQTIDGCIARARFLHVSNVDKRKHFRVRTKIVADGNRELGIFQSAPVRVISKPSKRKFSMSNLDMRIDSGEVVALFNRVRSQPGSTRFLGSSASAFSLSTSRWGTFEIIRRSPAHKPVVVHHNAISDFVHYNMTVVLKSRESGLLSAEYVIRKVERSTVNMADSDPVSQLQKVAFFIKGSDRMYLASQDGDVTIRQSKVSSNGADVLFDNCIWTIGSAEIETHSLCVRYQVPSLSRQFSGFMSQPTVLRLQHRGEAVELIGSDFHEFLTVWFESVPADTAFRSQDQILCKPPAIALFSQNSTPKKLPFSVHVLLVRTDGVVYRTNYTYTYPLPTDGRSGPSLHKGDVGVAEPIVRPVESGPRTTTKPWDEPVSENGGEPQAGERDDVSGRNPYTPSPPQVSQTTPPAHF